MEVITVVKQTFDNMENNIDAAISEETVKTFAGDTATRTAFGRAGDYIESLPPVRLYLGWNGEVYPKYILKKTHSS